MNVTSFTKWFSITLITIGLSFSLTSFKESYFEISKNLDIFSTLYKELNIYYVDETEPGELMKKGIDAMLKSLDPYTNYIPEADIEDYRFMTTGQYGGIGSVIRKKDNKIIIAEPYLNSPSLKAGLKAGDALIRIDGKDVLGKEVSEISSFLKGQPNTNVVLTIERPGREGAFDIVVTREEIKVKDVPYYGIVEGKTGYIKLNSFTQSASKEVKSALLELKEKHQIEKLIFDLRGNGGGLLIEAVNIVNLFIDKGQKVVETRGKIKDWDRTHKTLNNPIDKEIPLVVLTDGGSASASEIVSGTLQDLDRAVVIGENTFGKGLVQQTFDVSYNSKLKVTVAKYYIPSGRCIQRLDYANKDNKGKAIEIADSLIQTFKTKNGRVVKDGAGILPDIHVEKPLYGEIVFSLVKENVLFDFATQYALTHKTIDSARFFRLTQEEYKQFISFAKEKKYSYETQLEKELKTLEKVSNQNKKIDLSNEIKALKAKVEAFKKNDMLTYQEQIKQLLEMEISTRYFYQRGKIENRLSNDPDIKKASEVLNNSNVYSSIFNSDYTPILPKKESDE